MYFSKQPYMGKEQNMPQMDNNDMGHMGHMSNMGQMEMNMSSPSQKTGPSGIMNPKNNPAMSPNITSNMNPNINPSVNPVMNANQNEMLNPKGSKAMNPNPMNPGQNMIMQTQRGNNQMPEEAMRMPQTVADVFFTPGFLKTQIGKQMRVQFLIGSNAPLVDRIGTLRYVGASYIILELTNTDDLEMCDLYSIKFVTIYQ